MSCGCIDMKINYKGGLKQFQLRETNGHSKSFKIEKQRLEPGSILGSKHFYKGLIFVGLEKELMIQNYSPTQPQAQTQDTRSQLENHVTKFSFATKAGKSLKNPNKKNQDQYIVEPIFLGKRDIHFFGVCDGHGTNGKLVSSLIKKELPVILKLYLEKLETPENDQNLTFCEPSSDQITNALAKSFKDINELLYRQPFDIQFSGST